jgi:hypothetical protein
VPLRHGVSRVAPTGPIPTDRESLTSIAAVIGTIVAAIIIGLVFANLNPTDPTVGLGPSPTETPTPEPTPSPSLLPTTSAPPATATAPPSATPAPLPGTVAFGTGISNGQIQNPTDTFTPGMMFAHVVTMAEPFGVSTLGEQVVRVAEDGTETEVVSAAGNQLRVSPDAMSAGVICCDARELIRELGPGTFILRVYRNDQVIAQGQFIFAEG